MTTYFFLPSENLALDKREYQENIFSYFSTKTYVVGTH